MIPLNKSSPGKKRRMPPSLTNSSLLCRIDKRELNFEFFGFAERCTKTQPLQVFEGI